MAIDINGFEVLKAIASKPDLFGDIQSDVAKAARALIAKQLKAKSLTLDKIRKLFDILKEDQFVKILDGLKDNELRAVARKIDKNNNIATEAAGDKNRRLLISLAEGSAEPAPKLSSVPKAAKAKSATKKKVTRAISSEAMAARWDGTNPDDPKKVGP